MTQSELDSFRFIFTEDGSPSAIYLKPDGSEESMHHSQGAFSESMYIYYDAIRFVSQSYWPQNYLSVGLGLGYNELILAAHWLSSKTDQKQPFYIESYEKNQEIRETFLSWIHGEKAKGHKKLWYETYDLILEFVSREFSVAPLTIKNLLTDFYMTGQAQLKGELNLQTKFQKKFSCVFYDAFSSNTNPELWSEDFLLYILTHALASKCVFSTYASTGDLNRALRSQGFLLEARHGFGGKRQSTFGVKVEFQTEKLRLLQTSDV